MTDQPMPDQPTVAKRRPFDSLRVDPKKTSAGVWRQHPDSQDRIRVRRLYCLEHIRAIEQATADYEAKHGPKSSETPEGQKFVEATAMATGLITGWELHGEPDRPYDAAEMAATLVEPGYADLRTWILIDSSQRTHFRTDDVAGN